MELKFPDASYKKHDIDGSGGLSVDEARSLSDDEAARLIVLNMADEGLSEVDAAKFLKSLGAERERAILKSMLATYRAPALTLCDEVGAAGREALACETAGAPRLSFGAGRGFLPVDEAVLGGMPANFPGRGEAAWNDAAFETETEKLLASGDFSHTLFIVDTGHGVPVGTVLAEHGYRPAFYIPENSVDLIGKMRLMSQTRDYAARLAAAKAAPPPQQGFALLLDVHREMDFVYDTSVFPNAEELRERGITRVVVLAEDDPGPVAIEAATDFGIVEYLLSLQGEGFGVEAYGVDPRHAGPG